MSTGADFDLRPGRVHVWWSRPISRQPGRWTVLGAHERRQHDRLRRPADRHRYLTAHALTRVVLGGYLGRAPASLEFAARCGACGGPHGKPYLVGAPTGIEFSLSHSGALVCVAVALTPVGVDVEELSSYAGGPELVHEALSEVEQDSWWALPQDERPAGFLRYWTRKESVLKATGAGLSVPPRALEVSAPDSPAALLSWERSGAAAPIHLKDLHPGAGYLGCVATIGADAPTIDERDGERLLTRHPNRSVVATIGADAPTVDERDGERFLTRHPNRSVTAQVVLHG